MIEPRLLELAKAIRTSTRLLVSYIDGALTYAELVSELAKLPEEITSSFPETISYPQTKSLKSEVEALRAAIKAGETITLGGKSDKSSS